jgi:hypothetical protein
VSVQNLERRLSLDVLLDQRALNTMETLDPQVEADLVVSPFSRREVRHLLQAKMAAASVALAHSKLIDQHQQALDSSHPAQYLLAVSLPPKNVLHS